MWLIQGQPPGNGQEYELIVRRFEHVPLLTAARTDRLNLKLCGVPGSTYLIDTSVGASFVSTSLWSIVTLGQHVEVLDGGRLDTEQSRFFRVTPLGP